MKRRAKRYARLTAIIVFNIFLALTVRSVFASAYKIPSGSMYPTLVIGDHILANKTAYGIRNPFTRTCIAWCALPNHDDVIIFISPIDRNNDFIKRVVGIAGDVVEMKNGTLIRNGEAVTEPINFSIHQTPTSRFAERMDSFGPIRVPESKVFVLGDNRDKSYDSRYWGFVDAEDVRGKAIVIYWSWVSDNSQVRWDRIGRIIR